MAKFAGFEPGQPTVFPTHPEWPWNDKQVAFDATAGRNSDAIVIRFRPIRIAVAIVNRIYQARLGWRSAGRHSEIGIATKVSQQADFISKATPAAIRPRIVQGPVAMDESER